MLISLYFLKKFCSIKLLRIARNKKKGKCKHLGLSSLNLLRTSEEHRKLVEGIMKRGKIGRLKIEAVGISYECPEIVRNILFTLLFFSVLLAFILKGYFTDLILYFPIAC